MKNPKQVDFIFAFAFCAVLLVGCTNSPPSNDAGLVSEQKQTKRSPNPAHKKGMTPCQ
jgi:hypothetical protein